MLNVKIFHDGQKFEYFYITFKIILFSQYEESRNDGIRDDDDSRNNDGARKCLYFNLNPARFNRESGTATDGVSTPGTARLSCRPDQGPFFL